MMGSKSTFPQGVDPQHHVAGRGHPRGHSWAILQHPCTLQTVPMLGKSRCADAVRALLLRLSSAQAMCHMQVLVTAEAACCNAHPNAYSTTDVV